MNTSLNVESGVQLLARLTRRPSLNRLWPTLPISQLPAGAVVEISGPPAAGKSVLVADGACNALLPPQYGGCGAGVVVFNTDGNFNTNWFLSSLCKKVGDALNKEDLPQLSDIVGKTLNNFMVADIYDNTQLLISLENLELMLTDYLNISLIIFDTLTAFYWSDQGAKLQKMDTYLKNLIRKIKKVTKEHKVTILYTKPQYFSSKQDGIETIETTVKDILSERLNCRIQVDKNKNESNENLFHVSVSTSDAKTRHNFKTEKDCIAWM